MYSFDFWPASTHHIPQFIVNPNRQYIEYILDPSPSHSVDLTAPAPLSLDGSNHWNVDLEPVVHDGRGRIGWIPQPEQHLNMAFETLPLKHMQRSIGTCSV